MKVAFFMLILTPEDWGGVTPILWAVADVPLSWEGGGSIFNRD